MAKIKNDKLKKILRQARQPEISPDFTIEVLREIKAMDVGGVSADIDLKIMLRKTEMAMPSSTFTYKVLNKVRQQSDTLPYKPVIGMGVWSLIVSILALGLIIATATPSSNGDVFYANPIGDYLGDLFVRLKEPLSYLGIVLATGGSLLLLDFLASRKVLRKQPPGSFL